MNSGKRWVCAKSAWYSERGISRGSIGRVKGGFICPTMDGPQCLPRLLRSILGWGRVGAAFELFGEAAGIDEAGFAGDLGGG